MKNMGKKKFAVTNFVSMKSGKKQKIVKLFSTGKRFRAIWSGIALKLNIRAKQGWEYQGIEK